MPVRLHYRDHPEEVEVYAMLDDCSQATFIHQDVLDKLQKLHHMKTSITLNTLAVEETELSDAVEGLIIIIIIFLIYCWLKTIQK